MSDQPSQNRTISAPREECQFTFVRSSGPGGQNVNKLNTKAVLRWQISSSESLSEAVRRRFMTKYRNRITKEGEFVLTSQRFRDQARNVEDCLAKLDAMLASVAVAPKKRKKSKPSPAARRRRLEEKKRGSEKKQSRRFRPEID